MEKLNFKIPKLKETRMNWGKMFRFVVWFLFSVVVISEGYSAYRALKANWLEIKFAWDYPVLVRRQRLAYEAYLKSLFRRCLQKENIIKRI